MRFIILCACVLGVYSVSDNIQYMDNIIKTHEKLLNKTVENINHNMKKGATTQCDFDRACEYQTDFGHYDGTFYNSSFYRNVTVNLDHMMTKKAYFPKKDMLQKTCLVNEEEEQWKDNFEKHNQSIAWQYYSGTNGIYSIYPSFDWTDVMSCSDMFFPTIRPAYISGTTGKKNIVIFLDGSTAIGNFVQRISSEKILAEMFIDILSNFDFVNVIVYDEDVNMYNNLMVRATSENRKLVTEYIKNIPVPNTTVKSNIGLAIQEAVNMMENSIDEYSTANCYTVFLLLTYGGSGILDINPISAYEKASFKPIVISYVFDPEIIMESPILYPTLLACKSDGYTMEMSRLFGREDGYMRSITLPIQFHKAVDQFADYILTGLYISKPRITNVYCDVFKQGHVITMSMPIYNLTDGVNRTVGVASIDIRMNNFTNNNTITPDEVVSYIYNNQICSNPVFPKSEIEKFQKENNCKSLERTLQSDDPDYVKKKSAIAASTAVISIVLMTILPLGIVLWVNDDRPLRMILIYMLGFAFIAWIWFWLTFWLGIWPDMIKVNDWDPATVITEDRRVNEYACTALIDCQCRNIYRVDSCGVARQKMMRNNKTHDSIHCDDGYMCCQWEEYECNCQWECDDDDDFGGCYETCDTCERCVDDVSHSQCTAIKGVCRNVIFTESFMNSNTRERVYLEKVKQCPINNMGCVHDFDKLYMPIGRTRSIYFNPHNPKETKDHVGYNTGLFVCLGIPATYLFITYFLFVVFAFQKFKEYRARQPYDNLKG